MRRVLRGCCSAFPECICSVSDCRCRRREEGPGHTHLYVVREGTPSAFVLAAPEDCDVLAKLVACGAARVWIIVQYQLLCPSLSILPRPSHARSVPELTRIVRSSKRLLERVTTANTSCACFLESRTVGCAAARTTSCRRAGDGECLGGRHA